MSVHHIHPHVMHHNDKEHNDAHFNDHNNIFKNLDHVFHNDHHNFGNGHSFTATYSNNNGHVTKHFSKDGKNIDSDHAQEMMKQMHRNMANMDKMFNDDLNLNDFDHMNHNLDHMIGSHHSGHKRHNPFQRLADHFKK